MKPVYIMKNHHTTEGGNFCLYDERHRFIEERYMTFDAAKALGLVGVSPYQVWLWENSR